MAQLRSIEVPERASLADLLFEQGVEFPCGGTTACGGCRVRLVEGEIAVTEGMRDALSDDELAAGWRLACQAQARGRVTIEIEQWEGPILSDEAKMPARNGEGLGIAIDLGTTTLVAQLLDFATGDVLGVRTALNPQSAHGADVMSRVQFDLREAGVLTRAIRQGLGALVRDLAAGREVSEVLLCGNTVMHHLFCGEDVRPLSHVPFHPSADGWRQFNAGELGWDLPSDCRAAFLPCLGGFVGSDILAGMMAVDWPVRDRLTALIDLGTNGEIVLGSRHRALCASTAAGPAFEAGCIHMGMRAAPGAIAHVSAGQSGFECHVLGGSAPQGICGSGLVDAVAAGLQLGRILASGRLANGAKELELMPPVFMTQSDVRQVQLAKGAIAAGLRILLKRWGANHGDIERVYLAGAFGNYVASASAYRIGLLEVEPARIDQAGNTALRGTKMLLLGRAGREAQITGMRRITEHVALASDPEFQDVFVDCMGF